MIGDSLVKDPKLNTFWLQALIGKGQKLDIKDLKQNAAMPLSSFLRFDPWTDQVVQLHTAYEPILSSRDKMPFEVTPVYFKLAYYKPPVAPDAAPAAAAGTPATAPAASPADAPATADPAPASAPASAAAQPAATGTASPQQ